MNQQHWHHPGACWNADSRAQRQTPESEPALQQDTQVTCMHIKGGEALF